MQFVDKKKRLLLSQSAGGGKLLLFCAAVFIPILCWYLAESGEYNRVQDRLSRAGKMRQTMLASELAVDIDRLLSVERFFASSESVLPDEFRTFTYNLIGPSSSISSIAWIAKEGAAYRTVYSEPPRDSEIRSALEVPELRAALDRAEMSGAARAAIAPSFRLAGGQPDASIYLIVPELKTANEAGASAESDSRGFAVGKIKLSRLTTSALRSLLPDGPEMRIFRATGPELEFATGDPLSGSLLGLIGLDASALVDQESLAVADQELSLIFRPTADFVARQIITLPEMALLSSFLTMVIICFYVVSLQRRQTAAEIDACAKRDFIARISHEIRTPLTAIVGFSERLIETKSSDAEQRECARVVRRNADHLLSVVNDILDASKLDAGRLTVCKERCNLFEIIDDVKVLFEKEAAKKGLAFTIRQDEWVPELIYSDPLRIKQILLNVIGNAVKFTTSGSVGVDIQLDTDARELVFQVSDTGIGLSAEQRSRLFTDFSQAELTTAMRYGGTGLGLSISKRLAQLLGGDISVDSELQRGSTFRISIRCEPVHESLSCISETPVESVHPVPEAVPQFGGKVLVAEDGIDNQNLLRYLLAKAGFDIQIVENGELAVTSALTDQFSVVIMDMQMPVMDGYTAVERLRASGYSVPIIACTGDASPADVRRVTMVGCTDYVLKPFTADQLYRILRKHVPETGGSVVLDPCDPELENLRTEFLRTLPDKINEIRSSAAAGDLDAAARAAHKLGGTSMLGLAELSRLSLSFEEAVRDGEAAVIAERLAMLTSYSSQLPSP